MQMSRIIHKEPIKDSTFRIVAWLEVDDLGNQQLKAFNGRILGWYDHKRNITQAFDMKVLSWNSNILMTLCPKKP